MVKLPKLNKKNVSIGVAVVVAVIVVSYFASPKFHNWVNNLFSKNEENFIPVAQSLTVGSAGQYTRPSYKSQLPPRFGSTLTGVVKGPQAPSHLQASPGHSIDLVSAVGSCGDLPPELQGMSQREINNAVHEQFEAPLQYLESEDLLPQPQLGVNSYGNDPRDPNTFMYDRMIYANQKRPLLEDNDYIRGSLPIQPVMRGYHDVVPKPHLDLRRGALEHLGDFQTHLEKQDIFMKNTRFEKLFAEQC